MRKTVTKTKKKKTTPAEAAPGSEVVVQAELDAAKWRGMDDAAVLTTQSDALAQIRAVLDAYGPELSAALAASGAARASGEAAPRVHFTLALDAALCAALDAEAKAQRLSRAALIRRTLADAVGLLP